MYGTNTRKRKRSEQVVPAIGEVPGGDSRRLSADAGYARQTADPFDNVDYPIKDFQRVYNLMRHPVDGLKCEDRRYHLVLPYSKCFVGSEAVQWMVDNLGLDRPAAITTGQSLMDAGILHHVTHSEPFCDDYYFYRFQEDDDTNILNMKRVWDSAINTRHAVDVSKDLLTRLAVLCEEHRKRILEGKQLSKDNNSPSAAVRASPALNDLPQPTLTAPSTPLHDVTSRLLTRSFSTPPFSSKPLLGTSPRIMSNPLIRTSIAPTFTAAPAYAVGDDVDYSALAKSEAFRKYTLNAAELQRVQLVALNHEERIAFFVNCYNLLCLHGYVSHGPPNNLYRRYVFFRALSYRIAGLDMTLDDIEHGVLRGNKRPPMFRFMQQLRPSDPRCQHVLTKRDGRIHFVISAGTRSDPPIRILDGENVQEELSEATVEFLSYSVKVDVEKREVTLPRIFLWYAEDFPSPEKNLLMWVARFLPPKTSDQLVSLVTSSETPPTITHENFDWGNAEARFNNSVIRRKRRKLDRELSTDEGALGFSFQNQGDGMSPFLSGNSFRTSNGTVGDAPGGGSRISPSVNATRAAFAAVFSVGEGNASVVQEVSESAAISNASKTNVTKEEVEDQSKSENTTNNA